MHTSALVLKAPSNLALVHRPAHMSTSSTARPEGELEPAGAAAALMRRASEGDSAIVDLGLAKPKANGPGPSAWA